MMVIVDLDSTVINLHGALVKRIIKQYPNFSMNRVLTYGFNKDLSPELVPQWLKDTDDGSGDYMLNASRELIFKQFGDVNLFKEAEMFEGVVEGLIEVAKKYKVVFNSLSFQKDIADYKVELIHRLFDGKCDYTSVNTVGNKKPAILGADFVIEDNLYDLEDYIKFNGAKPLLVDKPYNQAKYNPSLSGITSQVLRFETTKDILDYLLAYVRH